MERVIETNKELVEKDGSFEDKIKPRQLYLIFLVFQVKT